MITLQHLLCAPWIGALDVKLSAIDAKLTAEFKEYAELGNPNRLGAAAQALLAPAAPNAAVAFIQVEEAIELRQSKAEPMTIAQVMQATPKAR